MLLPCHSLCQNEDVPVFLLVCGVCGCLTTCLSVQDTSISTWMVGHTRPSKQTPAIPVTLFGQCPAEQYARITLMLLKSVMTKVRHVSERRGKDGGAAQLKGALSVQTAGTRRPEDWRAPWKSIAPASHPASLLLPTGCMAKAGLNPSCHQSRFPQNPNQTLRSWQKACFRES